MTVSFRQAAAFLLSAACIAASAGCASRPGDENGRLKVLMIGNSFSICTLRYLPYVAQDRGKKLDLASLYIGGCSLERHWENVEAAATNKLFRPYAYNRSVDGKPMEGVHRRNIQEVLETERWDVVTVQQASHYSWQPDSYAPFGDRLVDYIRRHAPQARVVVQETWSYTPWDKRLKDWDIDQNEMYARLHGAYAAFAARHGLKVIPMGAAVQAWRERLPVKYTENSFGGDVVGGGRQDPRDHFKRRADNSWAPNCDVFHLNPRGEYLQALVWAAFFFGPDSLDGLGFCPPGVSESDAKLMREIAASVVSAQKTANPQEKEK